MKLGIVKEVHPSERRVALSPKYTEKLVKKGFEVCIEKGAGAHAGFTDERYEAVGATLMEGPESVWQSADLVAKIRPPMMHPQGGVHETAWLKEGGKLISFLFAEQNKDCVEQLQAKKSTTLAIEKIPRTTKAQRMDILSSMANIAGYRAVIEAATQYGSFFTGQHTAAGAVAPAKVLIIGAGVAGLAAIGAARGLGAVVRAFDTRPATKEQVESLGGEFLEMEFEESGDGGGGYAKVMSKEFIEAEMALFLEQAPEVDIVITTALIPGKKAPLLWTEDHVKAMKPGSVVVDMAAEQGGNCEVTEPGKVATKHGVHIIGYEDLPSRMAEVSSDLFAANITNLLDEMGGAENFAIDLENEIIRGATVVHEGEILPPPEPPKMLAAKPAPAPAPVPEVSQAAADEEAKAASGSIWGTLFSLVALALVGAWVYMRFAMAGDALAPSTSDFLQHLTVFVLACFVGWQVVWNVTAALHTPLMSVTNAISGIIIVGGLLSGNGDTMNAALIIGAIATLFATINIAGGFLVTQRMLQMFRK